MNVWPMMRRLRSGSRSPASRSRNRCSARTVTSGTSRCSRKSASTSSRSRSRKRPLSTNTQVSRSPIAWCTSTAATEESTPPESAHSARRSPTCARIRAAASAMNASIVQALAQPQIRWAKLARICAPACVWATSGWNCTPQIGRCASRTAANGEFSLVPSTTKPGGRRSTRSPWLIHTTRSAPPGRSANSGSSRSSLNSARPYSRSSAFSTRPPSRWASNCRP